MKRTMLVFAACLSLSAGLVPGVCAAQTRPAKAVKAETLGQYQKVTKLDFENDEVTGDIVRPDGDTVTGVNRSKKPSLIRVRLNFVPEMLKSVESL